MRKRKWIMRKTKFTMKKYIFIMNLPLSYLWCSLTSRFCSLDLSFKTGCSQIFYRLYTLKVFIVFIISIFSLLLYVFHYQFTTSHYNLTFPIMSFLYLLLLHSFNWYTFKDILSPSVRLIEASENSRKD